MDWLGSAHGSTCRHSWVCGGAAKSLLWPAVEIEFQDDPIANRQRIHLYLQPTRTLGQPVGIQPTAILHHARRFQQLGRCDLLYRPRGASSHQATLELPDRFVDDARAHQPGSRFAQFTQDSASLHISISINSPASTSRSSCSGFISSSTRAKDCNAANSLASMLSRSCCSTPNRKTSDRPDWPQSAYAPRRFCPCQVAGPAACRPAHPVRHQCARRPSQSLCSHLPFAYPGTAPWAPQLQVIEGIGG
jgi:hypothetical protein